MKRSCDEPQPSGGKQSRPQRLSAEEVRLQLALSDDENLDSDADFSESSGESDSSEDLDSSDNEISEVRSRSRPSPSTQGRGRGSRTADGRGDRGRNFDIDWTNAFTSPLIDLKSEFDSQNLGSVNDTLTVDNEILDHISLFMDDEFWTNLSEMTNRRAQQTKKDKPNFYHAKNFTDTTVQEMKAFVGIRLYMEYCCLKLSYRDYWNIEGTDFVGFAPNYHTVMTRDIFLAIWTFNKTENSFPKL